MESEGGARSGILENVFTRSDSLVQDGSLGAVDEAERSMTTPDGRTCYMCERPATGREHIPPRCLFPKQKDSPDGKDYRKNLMSVPACDLHNTEKSKDDEYLRFVVASALSSNWMAAHLFETVIIRSVKRTTSLANRITSNALPVSLASPTLPTTFQSIAPTFEKARLVEVLGQLARGLHFNSFDSKCTHAVRVMPEFLYDKPGHNNNPEDQELRLSLDPSLVDRIFKDISPRGANPSIFTYQIWGNPTMPMWFMRLNFYEGTKVSIMFGEPEQDRALQGP